MMNFPRRSAELQRLQQKTGGAPQPAAVPAPEPSVPEEPETAVEASPGRRLSPLAVAAVVLAVLGVLFLGLFWRENRAYRVSEQLYQGLAERVVIPAASGKESTIDFDALRAQNAETVAWLELPGLELQLPVTRHSDNDYYLHHAFDNSANNSGCLFLAAQDDPDLGDLYNVVYGHNIHTGAMFGNLLNYSDVLFFAQHPTFALYTPGGSYTCTIFSCHPAEDGDEVYTSGWQPGEEYDEFLARLQALSSYATGVPVESGSRVITLSTCASPYASNTHRFVVHAVMEPVE